MIKMNQETEVLVRQEYNLFGQKSKATGTFHFFNTTHLSGDIEGEITMDAEAPLTIESSAYIRGLIKGSRIEIFGKIEGSINCSELLIIHSSAIVSGEIIAKNLIVRPGAIVNMECQTEAR
ncbi:MAG: hypothetical protein COW00_16760 [Bdellovibrio sp. CG12_big_fil_rev_8_21_14_0_65_39_13]|nr:MAG: hypothetical protein COW78_10050 [Bdellovibrio sp. CG22_combo_CG10-13_8_21_14_all_39_27]PIQ58256.1 MAG: hypothetical protein COW00_16760 [Bdellovibrio sp. CG12_big_fil_rev_8_21_14_0_65_39_13]PIR36665.1 MAG: hypothetical protein COV37_02280 [Bdellovibrio sp. CG11_big_fil_rev_8_21_14_0_20_39_38]